MSLEVTAVLLYSSTVWLALSLDAAYIGLLGSIILLLAGIEVVLGLALVLRYSLTSTSLTTSELLLLSS